VIHHRPAEVPPRFVLVPCLKLAHGAQCTSRHWRCGSGPLAGRRVAGWLPVQSAWRSFG
jgi:hypothetical protein